MLAELHSQDCIRLIGSSQIKILDFILIFAGLFG